MNTIRKFLWEVGPLSALFIEVTSMMADAWRVPSILSCVESALGPTPVPTFKLQELFFARPTRQAPVNNKDKKKCQLNGSMTCLSDCQKWKFRYLGPDLETCCLYVPPWSPPRSSNTCILYRTTMWNFLGFGHLAGVCYDFHFLRSNCNLVSLDAEERS